jgi:hypothetical protein
MKQKVNITCGEWEAYFKVLRKITKILGQDSNRVPPEYKSTALELWLKYTARFKILYFKQVKQTIPNK